MGGERVGWEEGEERVGQDEGGERVGGGWGEGWLGIEGGERVGWEEGGERVGLEGGMEGKGREGCVCEMCGCEGGVCFRIVNSISSLPVNGCRHFQRRCSPGWTSSRGSTVYRSG